MRRLLPFMLTFAVGLFIASFFVSITGPAFQFSNERGKRRHECRRARSENKELKQENMRLRDELNELRRSPVNLKYMEEELRLPTDADVPPPPIAPLKPAFRKHR